MRKILGGLFGGGGGHAQAQPQNDPPLAPVYVSPPKSWESNDFVPARHPVKPSKPPSSGGGGGGGHAALTDSAFARALAAEDEVYAGEKGVDQHRYESSAFAGGGGGRVGLTDSALARVLAAEDDPDLGLNQGTESGLTVVCPYLGCTSGRVALEGFVNHVTNHHASASSHKYACPVCTLATGETYTVHDNTHLMNHLRAAHTGDDVAAPSSTSTSSSLAPSTHHLSVRCPYAGCTAPPVPTGSFVAHVTRYHSAAASHSLACPLCFLVTGTNYTVHGGTNLLTHLQAVHQGGGADPIVAGLGQPNVDELSYEELLALEERMGSVAIAPSAVTVDQLPTHPFSTAQLRRTAGEGEELDEQLTTCTICLVEYEDGELLKTLPCLHSYHQECIDEWLSGKKLCPICKFDITTAPSTYS